MTSFFGEIRRRNVVKVAVAYAIVGWLLIEVSTTVLPLFEAPDWIAQVFAFFIILGFPVALILSWAYELTPEGIKLERDVAAGESITRVTGRKLDFAIIGALVLALGFVVYNYVLEGGDVAGVLPNSVAVIPFENLSPDPDNDYYAAGIHEEILNHLVKLSALNVIARTSMQRYENTEKSIPEIAGELNVETVMEGSVRYADGRIRITAQLNDGVTGAHLWSETYTRDFDDIFAIESDVAMNVANALEAEFSLEEQQSIEERPTDSPAAYALYLRAISAATSNPGFSWDQDLDRAIEIDPEFALAHAAKAYWYANSPPNEEWQRTALRHAELALDLDSTLGLAHVAQATIYQAEWRFSEAQEAYQRAYSLNPNDPQILQIYGNFERYVGHYDDAVRLGQQAVALGPNQEFLHYQLGISQRYQQDFDASARAFRETFSLDPSFGLAHVLLGQVEALRGNLVEARTQLQIGEQLLGSGVAPYRVAQMALGYGIAGDREEVSRLFVVFERSQADDAAWAMLHMALGDYDQAFIRLDDATSNRNSDRRPLADIKANFWADPVLDSARFQTLRDRIGALD